MKNDEKLAEQFCNMHGWEKVDGYLIDLSGTENDGIYIDKRGFKDYVRKCIFWQYTHEEEVAYEDVWDVVAHIEDHSEINFDDFKKGVGSK